jgi:hypothetical protein
MSRVSGAHYPAHMSYRICVHLLTAPKCPALKLLCALHQLVYFLWRSRPEAGDIAVENQNKGYQWHDVGEEEMGGGLPEEAPRV